MNARLLAPVLFLVALAHAQAHPGHHPAEHGIGHLLASPYHLVTLALVGVAFFAVAKLITHRAASRCLVIAGVLAVAGAGLGWFFGA